MIAEKLLDRLDKVKRTGEGRWLACCPAHADQHPSLAIRETADGMVLVHCFTGCGVDQILSAVSLEFSDLYPEKAPEEHHRKPERAPYSAKDVLKALAYEALIVDCAVGTLQRKGYLSDDECERMALASDRITGALSYAGIHE